MFASSDEFAELFSRCFLGSFNPTVVGVGLSALAEERLGMFAMFMSRRDPVWILDLVGDSINFNNLVYR